MSLPKHWFKWWYKGITTEGNVLKLEGVIHAINDAVASETVEAEMRAKHPTVRWMLGNYAESGNCKVGPTIQKLKRAPRWAQNRRRGNE